MNQNFEAAPAEPQPQIAPGNNASGLSGVTNVVRQRTIINDPLATVDHSGPSVKGVPETATRYGLFPIWDAEALKADSVYVNRIPAGSPHTFRSFPIPAANPSADTPAHTMEMTVTPFNQVRDMQIVYGNRGFRDFHDLAKLPEAEAQLILRTIFEPIECEKYDFYLEGTCATCRLKDLTENFATRIGEAPLSTAAREIANTTAGQVRDCLLLGLTEARGDFDRCVGEMNDPKTGVKNLSQPATRAMYHLHEIRPELRNAEAAKQYGEASNANLGAEIAKGVSEALGNQSNNQTNALLNDVLARVNLVAGQNDSLVKENTQIRAELDRMKAEASAAQAAKKPKD